MMLLIQQPVVPHYRVPFFRLLLTEVGPFVLAAGSINGDKTISTSEEILADVTLLRNRYILKGNFLWQSGLIRLALKADVVVLNFDIRHLSSWLVLLLRSAKRKRTILWGHAEGSRSYLHMLRFMMVRGSSKFIAYTETEANHVRKLYGVDRVTYLGNSCVYEAECQFKCNLVEDRNVVLYVGRLTKAKKPDLLLRAFIAAKDSGQLSSDCRLLLVGSGPLWEALKAEAKASNWYGSIEIPGEITEAKQLEKLYATAFCAVSPGYAGLSVIQALAFGVSFVLPRGEKHSPEVEACEEGFNSYYFQLENVESLASTLGVAYGERINRHKIGSAIALRIKERYTYEGMYRRFAEAIKS